MSETDRRMSLISGGKMAAIAAEHFGSLISEQKQSKMKALTSLVRGDKIDHDRLVVLAASLSALEDLEESMKRKILNAEKASNDLHKGAHL